MNRVGQCSLSMVVHVCLLFHLYLCLQLLDKVPENLPRDTKLRAVYADRLQAGLPVGWGKGIFVLK